MGPFKLFLLKVFPLLLTNPLNSRNLLLGKIMNRK